MEYIGNRGTQFLFSSGAEFAVVDESDNSVSTDVVITSIADWSHSLEISPSAISIELASAALTDLDIKVLSVNDRMYTIPKAVKAEAERGLRWRREEGRGGTSVGLNTARTLARGGQIGIRKVRHIARYFPRHEVDKKAEGYRPGEDGFPSNGRIAWALWGGDAAQRWASAIVRRENAANASFMPESSEDFASFASIDGLEASASEFYIRLFADGSGFDRLYRKDDNGELSVWDQGCWFDLGEAFTEFSSMDAHLDLSTLDVDFDHVIVDSDFALAASAYLDQRPDERILLSDINLVEARLAAYAFDEIDFSEIDSVTAAAPAPDSTPGEYTPEERSESASRQVRDASGRFAKSGSRVTTSDGRSGVITKINPDSASVSVRMDSGETVDVPANETRPEAQAMRDVAMPPVADQRPLDVSGIYGEPRDIFADQNRPQIPGTLPRLSKDDVGSLLSNWPTWVAQQRKAFKEYKPVKFVGVNNDPYTRAWLKTRGHKDFGKPYRPGASTKFSLDGLIAAAEAMDLTPDNTDIAPIFMAVVAEDDPQAVLDLISLVPATSKSTEPAIFVRKEGKWVRDEKYLADLRSPTPPPVVMLDEAALNSVLEQMSDSLEGMEQEKTAEMSVDEQLTAYWAERFGLSAAGGLDRNKGNAERLRRYWTIGPGGAKIRWNTPGDWTRCVRQLSKYLGPRAKGYCALRHKEMTGLWTGSKAHRQMYGRKGKGVFAMSDEMLLSEETIIEQAALRAQAQEARNRVLTASGGYAAPAETVYGAKFKIPLVVPEGVETGDGRRFSKGAITMRELPLPLMWQIKTAEGHFGSVVVGRIDHMERIDGGIGNAYGVFDSGEYGREAERLVRGGFIRGISADLDKFEAAEDMSDADYETGSKKKNSGKILISKARVMGVTLVPKPAFQECTIELVEEPDAVSSQDQAALIACASVVASIPVVPPRSWFENPKLAGPTPLTVTDDGRVFGHIAAWHVDHIGLAFGTKPPRSKSGYSYFHTGVIRTDDGSDVPVGQLTLAGGHAPLSADARSAAKHYDDTASSFADVHAGEDAYGIWVAGALRPSVSPEQVRAIRASAPSGDWRPIGGNLELVAVCQVNVPGFPIARARVASGQVYALVAAGASYLARIKEDPSILEAAEDVKARFAAIRSDLETTMTAGAGMMEKDKPLTVEVLERLLADVIAFSLRAQGYHWNVIGSNFPQYHELFGEIYEDVRGSIDPTAENVRKLGYFPPMNLMEFAKMSSIGESDIVAGPCEPMAADLLMANEAIVAELKAAFTVFEQANEQAIADFIAGRLDMHQKWSWQLASSVMPGDLIVKEDDAREDIFETVFASLAEAGLVASSEPHGDLAYISEKVRMRAAEKGQALPDGSYPIRNVMDLKNAIRAYGRSKPSKRAEVRAHIMKRARALKREDLIPDTFKDTATIEAAELAAIRDELSARVRGTFTVTAAAEAGESDEDAPKA